MRLACILLSLVACTDSKGPEEELPNDGKLDSFGAPTDHGAIVFGIAQTAKLTAAERYHSWTFNLGTAAEIHTYTRRTPHTASTDTVLYLYQRRSTGSWGSYVARNDDDGSSEWSSLDRTLGLGEYRVLVKGYASTTLGSFDVSVDCTGAGCAPPCLFGGSLGDLESNAAFVASPIQRLTSSGGLSTLDAQRIVLAMHESAHTDVMTVDEAFAAADQNEIDLYQVNHVATHRIFTVIDYGAGDNTYGALFTGDTTDIATAIHDGDFYRCAVN